MLALTDSVLARLAPGPTAWRALELLARLSNRMHESAAVRLWHYRQDLNQRPRKMNAFVVSG